MNGIMKFSRTVYDWVRYYFGFSKAILFITGLIVSQSLVDQGLVSILITYLTDKMELPQAVANVNVQDGIEAVMMIVMFYIADAYFGLFKVVLFSSVAYIVALVLFMFEVSRSIGLWLFYVSLILIIVGKVGLGTLLKAFVGNQFKVTNNDETRTDVQTKVWWRFASLLGIIAATLAFWDASWEQTSKVSALTIGGACIVFFTGSWFDLYHHCEPIGSSITLVFRVFMAATFKMHHDYPLDSSQLYKKSDDPLVLHTNHFRWLDKAAIIESSSLSLEVQEKKWKLCTTKEVEETKRLLAMIPMWTTFLIYGMVKSTGNTFFIEQADKMDSHIGPNIEVPAFLLLVIGSFSSHASSYLYELLFKRLPTSLQKYSTLVKIGVGMLFSILCFSIAWRVEGQRLNVYRNVKSHNTSMSMFWLVPQFCLLGITKGLAEDGLEDLFNDQVSESMKNYGPQFNNFVVAVGGLLSIVSVYATSSWFHKNINDSHLDKYYRMLTIFCYINFCLYFYIARRYMFKEATTENVELESIIITGSGEIGRLGLGEDTNQIESETIQQEEAEEVEQATVEEVKTGGLEELETIQEEEAEEVEQATIKEVKIGGVEEGTIRMGSFSKDGLRKRESFKKPSG